MMHKNEGPNCNLPLIKDLQVVVSYDFDFPIIHFIGYSSKRRIYCCLALDENTYLAFCYFGYVVVLQTSHAAQPQTIFD
jgi:hypothetical protein